MVVSLGRLSRIWEQLFAAERYRIAHLMIERVDLVDDGVQRGIRVRWRELGWDQLIGEFAPQEIGGASSRCWIKSGSSVEEKWQQRV